MVTSVTCAPPWGPPVSQKASKGFMNSIYFIKNTKLKVQAAIQQDTVRVSGKDRDTLQDIIARLKEHDFGIDMQYTNYRSN